MVRPKIKWKDQNYVKAYELAAQGMKNSEIARALGVSPLYMKKWRQENKAFDEAIVQGRERLTHGAETSLEAFNKYVYQNLPDDLRELWTKIQRCQDEKNGISRMEALLEREGKYARMHLWLHAYVTSNFNKSEACKRLNVSLTMVDQWLRTEPRFSELLDEVMEHKKNFFESALIRLVKRGDSPATIFANRTINRDRGYNDKQEVQVTGNIAHSHSQIDVDKMPLKLRIQVLEWIRSQRKDQTPALEYKMNGNKAVPVEEDAE